MRTGGASKLAWRGPFSRVGDRRLRAMLSPYRIALVNPNVDASATRAMLLVASSAVAPGFVVVGRTAPFGMPLITNDDALAVAALAVAAMAPSLAGDSFCGIIVSAFGDPGLQDLRKAVEVPVTGLAEAGMAEAAWEGRRFSIVTTTPDLAASIRGLAQAYGHGAGLASVRITPGDPFALMGDPEKLESALLAACDRAIDHDGAEAILIGGGPLSMAARTIAHKVRVPLVEPVPAAVRLACQRAGAVI
jgi:allantoin racemase